MTAMTMTRIEQTWIIRTAFLQHSLDANGDLSTLIFGFEIKGQRPPTFHSANIVPSPMFISMGGDNIRLANGLEFGVDGDNFLGTYSRTEPDGRYAILRSSQEAIFRMAQLFAAHLPITATVYGYESTDASGGIIDGFMLECIDLESNG